MTEAEIIQKLYDAGFDQKQIAALTVTRWKDGIDIQVPTLALERFVELLTSHK